MRITTRAIGVALILMSALRPAPLRAADRDASDARLPAGVRAVWDPALAWRETTPTRERVCVNGLWRWQPSSTEAPADPQAVPDGGWGYFKVPGCWPGITDYLQQDCQTVYPNSAWKDRRLGDVHAAWYQREIDVPAGWSGRRVALSIDTLNSYAGVYVNGAKAGEVRFPAGEVDLTATCKPGGRYVLSLWVVAMPMKGVRLSFSDTAAAREVKGSVSRRGLCGDVFLVATPAGPGIGDVRVETSFRQGTVNFDAAVDGLQADARYMLRARIGEGGREVGEFTSDPFGATGPSKGRIAFAAKWKPTKLWDIDTPANQYDVQLSLLDAGGNVLDASWPQRFGFRELWIDGRDFYLNGTRIFLCAVPLDNAVIGAAWADYAAARETFDRLKAIGVNCVYTHNYDCEPGAHLSYDQILRAADDAGVLVSLTQPHFSAYDWKAPDADEHNGYARDAAVYARVAGNHPSVAFYSTSHNATGYDGDMDPDLIDGLHDRRDTWSARNAKSALRAEAIIHRLDPARIVYHHAGGNIGSMHTVNFYPNFAPVQELCDWFAHWATAGVKPLFLCEYGAPLTWDWTMYRGWYHGTREFGSAAVPWEFCLAEWDAQFLGDRAYSLSEPEKANLRWEAKQFEAGTVWHRWDYPTPVGSPRFEARNEILAKYLTDNWRAYRTWGVSGISPWEYEIYWTLRPGADRGRRELKVNWDDLQRPGFSADYIDRRVERLDVAFNRDDWVPTAAGKALLRNNQPVLAYIAGKPAAFTSKDHNFSPGDVVEKQLIVINHSRRPVSAHCEWSISLNPPVADERGVTVETGQQIRIPLRFELPADAAPGRYELRAVVRFDAGEGEAQEDSFTLEVAPAPSPVHANAGVALFDPKGETAAILKELGVPFRQVDANADLSDVSTLVIGKLALTIDGPAPDVSRVRDGLKVIVFEQSSAALEQRLGFRATEYGLRQVFDRIPDHPLLAGLASHQLRDWRGEATTVSPRLAAQSRPMHGPTIQWCGIPVSRVWRCGNQGDVASVLIEKPARGDFRPILDGGFDLQYAPLLECREGSGVILFCQMDVTGRTESDPAARTLAANLFRYAAAFRPQPQRRAVYAGDAAGAGYLKACGIDAPPYDGADLTPADHVLILGPGCGATLAGHRAAIATFLKGGGHVLAIALEPHDADTVLPYKVSFKEVEHFGATFDAPGLLSLLCGVGPADVHSRAARSIPLVAGGADVIGDGTLALAPAGAADPLVVFCQEAPWRLDYPHNYGLKRTYRRAAFTLTRLLANLGVRGETPILHRFAAPAPAAERRWLDGLYLDVPEEWDDPYRFFRW